MASLFAADTVRPIGRRKLDLIHELKILKNRSVFGGWWHKKLVPGLHLDAAVRSSRLFRHEAYSVQARRERSVHSKAGDIPPLQAS